jgi:hypothetical protein
MFNESEHATGLEPVVHPDQHIGFSNDRDTSEMQPLIIDNVGDASCAKSSQRIGIDQTNDKDNGKQKNDC